LANFKGPLRGRRGMEGREGKDEGRGSGEEDREGKGRNGEERGKGGSWRNSALVVGGDRRP